MHLSEACRRLAAQQADLVQALAGQGPPPAGFDPERLRATAAALRSKRALAAAQAWPALAEALGGQFYVKFLAFAAKTTLPCDGGPLADGRLFIRSLAATGELPEAGRLEALAVDVRCVVAPNGVVPRRWPYAGATFLRQPPRLVIGVNLPFVGVKWLGIRLGPW